MGNSFAGKFVLVAGATSGIGQAVALAFRKNGARIPAVGRNQVALDELGGEGEDSSGVFKISADVTDNEVMRDVVDSVAAKFGRLDEMVNGAGHISTGTVEDTSLAAWDAMMNVNLRASFCLMQL